MSMALIRSVMKSMTESNVPKDRFTAAVRSSTERAAAREWDPVNPKADKENAKIRSRRYQWADGELRPAKVQFRESIETPRKGSFGWPTGGHDHELSLHTDEIGLHNASHAEHDSTLSDDHYKSHIAYKFGSEINEKHRDGLALDAEEKEHSGHLDDITSHKFQKPLTVYRGVADQKFSSKIARLKVDDIHHDPGFTSTSISPDVAMEFGRTINHPNDGGDLERHVVMQIHLKPGDRGYHMDRHESAWNKEQEVLLPRNTHFRITGHEHGIHISDGGHAHHMHIVHMDIEHQPHHPTQGRSERFHWRDGDLKKVDHADYQVHEETGSAPPGEWSNPVISGNNSLRASSVKGVHEESFAKHAETFEDQHIDSLKKYKGSSYEVNTAHRRETPLSESAKAISEDLDHVTSHQFMHPLVVYRGIGSTKLSQDISRMKIGDTHEDPAFVSTSARPNDALSFGVPIRNHPKDPDGTHRHVLMKIHLKPGDRGYHVDRHENGHSWEHEVVLPRGNQFRVMHHEHMTHRDEHGEHVKLHVVHMEVAGRRHD